MIEEAFPPNRRRHDIPVRSDEAVRVGVFGGILAAGFLLAFTSLRIPLVCPMRLVTGVPCPFCGLTTGTVSFLRGDFARALATNPASPAVVLGAAGGLIHSIRRMSGLAAARLLNSRRLRVIAVGVLAGLLTASWISQLIRFGIF